jgi:UDP:flavonoid glycosyltransferase YjiC (YdhE family)
MAALAHSLEQRGHEVVIFGIADTEARVRAAGIEFCAIGLKDYPPGTLDKLDIELARLHGFAAMKYTLQRIRDTAQMVMRDGPEAVRKANIDVLLVDEVDFAGNVADYLGLPWISIALIPPLLSDDRFPPFWLGWAAGQDRLSRLRNRIAIFSLLKFGSPIFDVVNRQRSAWGLRPYDRPEDGLSPLAQITQLPEALEFEMKGEKPAGLYYTGPWVHSSQRPEIEFPWERLDGRPLIYASMGTLQNGSESIFKIIAEACAGLDVQLVLSLGGGIDPRMLGNLAGDPIVVSYAPQLDLLKRAALVITHAGLNTVLESLAEGLPVVAVPLANDQPGVAARVKARGAGVVIPRGRLKASRLREAVTLVLERPSYRQAAKRLQDAITRIDGPGMAADLIEDVLQLRSGQTIAAALEKAL